MTLQSRFRAIERAARRRREHGYGAVVTPKLSFDRDDPQYRAVSARLAALFGEQIMHDQRDIARKVMENPELARQVRAVIGRARAKSPVSETGASGHE